MADYFDDYEPNEPSSNTLGWLFWTGVGLAGWKYGMSKPAHSAMGAASRFASNAVGSMASAVVNPGQTFKTLRSKFSGDSLRSMLHRPIAYADDLETVNELLLYPNMKGLSKNKLVRALGARYRGLTKAQAAGKVTLGDVLQHGSALGDSTAAQGSFGKLQLELQKAQILFKHHNMHGAAQNILAHPLMGFNLRQGKAVDVRSKVGLIPHLLDKVHLDEFYWPFLGRLESTERPFRWFSDLLFPTGLFREQRHVEAFVTPNQRAFLKLSVHDSSRPNVKNEVRSLFFKKGKDYIHGTDSLYPDPTAVDSVNIGKVAQTNAFLVEADTSLGKGILKRWTDQPNRVGYRKKGEALARYLKDVGIDDPGHWYARTISWMGDKLGIGPQFAAPVITEDKHGLPMASRKVGVFGGIFKSAYEKATGKAFLRQTEHSIKDHKVARSHVWLSDTDKTTRVVQGTSDFFNYMMLRPTALLEELTGIGVRAGSNPVGSLGNILLGVALPGWLGMQTLRYVDFMAKDELGVSPSESAANAYVGAQLTLAGIRDNLGITRAANKLEELFPGIIGSPLSTGARGLFGAYLGGEAGHKLSKLTGAGKILPGLGAIGGFLALGGDPRESQEKLKDIYSGAEPVSIRRSRFWEMGKDSWFGRDTWYHRPHMIHAMKSGAEEKAAYGSVEDYWRYGTYSPNFHNWFGIRKILNPNYAAVTNMYERPYPYSGSLGEDIPIVGPAVGALTSYLFGIDEHPLLRQSLNYQPVRYRAGERYLPAQMQGQQLAVDQMAVSRFRVDQALGKELSYLQDWFGLPGFMFGAMKSKIFGGGTDSFAESPQWETSDRITNTERWFYETLNIGGGFFTTELMRRFIPHRRRQIELINPIPNQMPSWMPGSKSEFARDREYFIDYHRGDPYTKTPAGEMRLPGRGYEASRPMHSGTPGVYSPVDRFMILSDVAPWSEAYKHYKSIVDTWSKAGLLDSEWETKVARAKERLEARLDSRSPGTPDPSAVPDMQTMKGTITQVTGDTTFRVAEMPGQTFRLAGIHRTRDSAARAMLASYNEQTIAAAREKTSVMYSDLRERLDQLKGQTIDIQIAKDPAARFTNQQVNAIIPGVSAKYYSEGLANKSEHGMANYLRSDPVTRGISGAYYDIASTDLPFPFGWPKNKLLPVRDPISDFYEFQVKSKRVALWENPYEGYIKPWARSWMDWVLPGDQVPGGFRDTQLINQRVEALRYMKLRGAAKAASDAQDPDALAYFEKMMKRTSIGFDATSPMDQAIYSRSVVSAEERPYVDAFRNTWDTSQRERILGLVSPSMQYMLMGHWKNQVPEGATLSMSPQMEELSGRLTPETYRATALSDLLANVELPGNEWAGWDPRVNVNAAKIKYIESTGEDIHNYGMWESEARLFDREFPDMPFPDLGASESSMATFHRNLSQMGMSSHLLGFGWNYSNQGIRSLDYRYDSMSYLMRAQQRGDYRLQSSLYSFR